MEGKSVMVLRPSGQGDQSKTIDPTIGTWDLSKNVLSGKSDSFGDYTAGRWAWRLEDVQSVEPHIPAKGCQQIGWEWTAPVGFAV